MSERSTRAGPIWDRLRRNRDRNAPIFADAGIRPENAASVVCPACGAEESALFWSTTRRRGKSIFLLCPICEAAHVRYNLVGNRVVDPVFNRGSVGGGLGVIFLLIGIGALFYFRETEPVRGLWDDLHLARASLVGGVDRVTAGRLSGGYDAPPAARGGGAGLRGGASSGSIGGSSTGGGGSTARGGSAGSSAAQPSARGASQRYALSGDRRAELEASSAVSAALREVRYDSAADVTYIIVDPTSRAGRRALDALPAAQRVEEP